MLACSPKIPKDQWGRQFFELDQRWKELQENDAQILKNIEQIDRLVTKSPKYEKNLHDSVRVWQKEVQKRRFSQADMQQSNLIDEYDLALIRLMNLTEKLKNSAQVPETEVIWQKIKEKDQWTIVKRTDYDLVADKINGMLAASPKKLTGKLKSLSKIPVFRITE